MTVTPTDTLDFALGRRLTEIAIGLDALERATSRGLGALDSEGLVPIFIGTDLVAVAAFATYGDVLDALDEFEAAIDALDDRVRREFLRGMTRSLRAATRLFAGAKLGFAEKLTNLVGVPAAPVPAETIAAIHDRLDRLMTARGGRYLDPERIPAVFGQLVAIAKAKTDAQLWPTGAYTMELRALRDVPYAGRCSFADGTMEINLDALLCTANAVTGAVQEGIGDQGIELIDWVEDDDEAAQIEVGRLQTAAGTNAAWHVHESGWTRAESIMALHPFRGPFSASYWFGNETVRALREDPQVDRTALDAALFGAVHSIDSLRLAVAKA